MNQWGIAILKTISSHAGTASLKYIYSEHAEYIKLTPKHEEITYKAPNYHHQTRAHVDDLLGSAEEAESGIRHNRKGQSEVKSRREEA